MTERARLAKKPFDSMTMACPVLKGIGLQRCVSDALFRLPRLRGEIDVGRAAEEDQARQRAVFFDDLIADVGDRTHVLHAYVVCPSAR